MLTADEQHDLNHARAYDSAKAGRHLITFSIELSTVRPDRPGAHIMGNHRQGFSKYSKDGLWCREEALCIRSTLFEWKKGMQMEDITSHSLVSQGLTRLLPTGTHSDDDLLHHIMAGRREARITARELELASQTSVGIFALSYRHQGPKGKNITTALWNDVLAIASSLAACAGFHFFTLWVDSISAAAKGEIPVSGYIDWFTIGVAPYLLLPTILIAGEKDRNERMWLRMEEKLSQYGPCCVYVLHSHGQVVRLEPGPLEMREPFERIWCLSQSVIRGEYNGMETTFPQDYVNLLEWAMAFTRNSVNFRGLEHVFRRGNGSSFREELPIEKGCYVIHEPLPETGWLYGAEAFSGRVELLIRKMDIRALQSLSEEAQAANSDKTMWLFKMRNRKRFCVQQLLTAGGSNHVARQRWRSYANSTLLIVDLGTRGWLSQRPYVRRTILVGLTVDVRMNEWDFSGRYGLDLIPEAVRQLLDVAHSSVVAVEPITGEDLYALLSL